jgi:hypothetical protein
VEAKWVDAGVVEVVEEEGEMRMRDLGWRSGGCIRKI